VPGFGVQGASHHYSASIETRDWETLSPASNPRALAGTIDLKVLAMRHREAMNVRAIALRAKSKQCISE